MSNSSNSYNTYNMTTTQVFSSSQLILNDRTIPITSSSAGGVNVANSAHPCVQSPCANGGTCRPKWDGYECDCPLGYDGRHCQKGPLICETLRLVSVTEVIKVGTGLLVEHLTG